MCTPCTASAHFTWHRAVHETTVQWSALYSPTLNTWRALTEHSQTSKAGGTKYRHITVCPVPQHCKGSTASSCTQPSAAAQSTPLRFNFVKYTVCSATDSVHPTHTLLYAAQSWRLAAPQPLGVHVLVQCKNPSPGGQEGFKGHTLSNHLHICCKQTGGLWHHAVMVIEHRSLMAIGVCVCVSAGSNLPSPKL